jgi:hypothetical protein
MPCSIYEGRLALGHRERSRACAKSAALPLCNQVCLMISLAQLRGLMPSSHFERFIQEMISK